MEKGLWCIIVKKELLEVLRCPSSGSKFQLINPVFENNEVKSGTLVSSKSNDKFKISNFIPRFVPNSNYADNFGMQWNKFSKTLLDSHSKHPISANRFWKSTGWKKEEISNNWVLDIGSGAGRFAEIALDAGAKVIALDYSNAVDACYSNLKHYKNFHVIQADIFFLPFLKNYFPFVYSLGVLQHTPNVNKAFNCVSSMVAPNGKLCVDFYWRRLRTLLHSKYLVRPITKRMNQEKLFKLLEKTTPYLLKSSRILESIPFIGKLLQRIVPVANYSNIYPLSEKKLIEWALMDTFDMLSPKYDSPQSKKRIFKWMKKCGYRNIEIFHSTLLVSRGVKK